MALERLLVRFPALDLAAPPARLEATMALERLLDRFPALDLAVPEDGLAREAGLVGNSVRALPVRLGV